MNRMKRCNLVFSILALAAVLAWPAAGPVRAQTGPRLSVQPPDSMLPVGNTVRIDLLVTNGTDVNAFDVTITYDPDVLGLTAWSFGPYLSNLAVVSQVNQPGSLRVAATQLATAPASGDGVLLRLDFQAEAAGATPVEITRAEFASPTGAKTEPERVGGTVTAVIAATFTPTATVTSTLTRTSTPLPTATLAPAATATAVPGATATALLGSTATRTAQPTQPGLTAAPSLPGETAAVPGLETAYPGQVLPELITLAPTVPVEALAETPPEGAEPTPEAVGEGQGLQAEPSAEETSWLEKLLWGVLIAAGAAIGIMFLIIIRRNMRREHHTEEDLLL